MHNQLTDLRAVISDLREKLRDSAAHHAQEHAAQQASIVRLLAENRALRSQLDIARQTNAVLRQIASWGGARTPQPTPERN